MKKLSEVVGANVRAMRLAAGKTTDDLAFAASKYGGTWSTGSIGEFELGHGGATLKNLLLLSAALSELTDETVTVADLCAGNGTVQLSSSITIDLADLQDALNSKPVILKRRTPRIRESERRVLRDLPLTPEQAADLAQQLWGRTFHDEREHRAEANANAQRRGQISRDLKAELRVVNRMRLGAE